MFGFDNESSVSTFDNFLGSPPMTVFGQMHFWFYLADILSQAFHPDDCLSDMPYLNPSSDNASAVYEYGGIAMEFQIEHLEA
ncbi:MAG: hypothetical protein OMM_14669 [Candidatus Magnetoglobus multicellularis str. Araruama]|uniref:Uncharacterized protein n=1 Tax=Candidatus Magnetoglobus multicellularis str. Araruama TaxID=890399 RepID=A0A1V1NRI3_9BACT|nr:MAG: hypothetical protein OMM_14669 [Candidatus Magnetoglobus multicellularis str. Araruama]